MKKKKILLYPDERGYTINKDKSKTKAKKAETYSTERAWQKVWKTTETTNAQADVFRSLADGLRRENLLIKKMLDERDKKITEQEIYIEQLERKVEALLERY